MSPRPRKVSDDQLFAATHAVMNRVGPADLTLSSIAEEAGVTAAVLVQRFGSKRGLLLALSRKFATDASDVIGALAAQHDSPLEALRAYAECMAGMATTPAAFARSLAYLQIDLADAGLRRQLVKQARVTRAGLERLLRAAVTRGELAAAMPARLARTLETVVSGSLLTWAFYQEGSAASWMRREIDAALEPYLVHRRRAGRR
jgi:AcrR family transcriptional regulator